MKEQMHSIPSVPKGPVDATRSPGAVFRKTARCLVSILCAVASVSCLAAVSGAQVQKTDTAEARALIQRIETQYQGRTSRAVAVMKVATDRWTREMTMEMHSEGREKFLVRILAPKKDEGVASLKIGEDMWNFLPNIDRLVKIPSSMMGESWMGSHLTNDDLVKENQIDRLYDFSMNRNGATAEVTATPKPDAAVVWGRIDYSIETGRLVPVVVKYYDEDGGLVRTITFDDVRSISGRWVPLKMVVKPEDKPGERTELVYRELVFDEKIPPDFFSIRSLRRR